MENSRLYSMDKAQNVAQIRHCSSAGIMLESMSWCACCECIDPATEYRNVHCSFRYYVIDIMIPHGCVIIVVVVRVNIYVSVY